MDEQRIIKVSKYLSRHLRHQPERIGLRPDRAGWVDVVDLLAACRRHRMALTEDELLEVVARNDKRRFALSPDGLRIRASQGHTITVDLELPSAPPPDVLYHGTVGAALPTIFRDGLRPMARHAVHLSPDVPTARRVGARRGRPVVLEVDAARMAADGHLFQVTDNGVWLTGHVPPRYLDVAGFVPEQTGPTGQG
ncbi:RNA 2'-phosphotransferase [Actinocorallia sp. API 0066]|uniref:RNA 2'-phosphotransferase n=1 Tax=Actinocorallia sp. API 0066 TaxID=2896846 RepID=UPI001E53439B|nr:RNA 2'-phosphotransferase [Actinocorallia sp. API 0066]MCD0453554.1 RNA 2'-phosphotransferase [Actinocorallia sp. API 0066]